MFRDVERATQRTGLELLGPPLEGSINEAEYRRVVSAMVGAKVDALLINEATENLVNAKLIIELAEQYRLPALYTYREQAELGGLMAYAVDFRSNHRQMAVDVDLILKGAKPGDIPIYLPDRIELLFNLKTARSLGISIPPILLAFADDLIE